MRQEGPRAEQVVQKGAMRAALAQAIRHRPCTLAGTQNTAKDGMPPHGYHIHGAGCVCQPLLLALVDDTFFAAADDVFAAETD